MAVFMYRACVPPLVRTLTNLRGILAAAAAHAEAHKIDPAVLLGLRLYPDMFPLTRQVQIATDNAKGVAARLAGLEPPRYEDDEASFAELYARIDKTLAYLASFKPEQFEGAETRPISLTLRDKTLNFDGATYLLEYALPNVYFHAATAYGILRHNGVAVGKKDFLGKFS